MPTFGKTRTFKFGRIKIAVTPHLLARKSGNSEQEFVTLLMLSDAGGTAEAHAARAIGFLNHKFLGKPYKLWLSDKTARIPAQATGD